MKKDQNEELLAAYYRKAILGATNLIIHYSLLAKMSPAVTHKEKFVIGKINATLKQFWERRNAYNAKIHEKELNEQEAIILNQDIERIANFIDRAILCNNGNEDEMGALYASIDNLVSMHNKKA